MGLEAGGGALDVCSLLGCDMGAWSLIAGVRDGGPSLYRGLVSTLW